MTTYWILLSHCGSAAVLTKREQERDGILAAGGKVVEQAYFPEPNAEAIAREWFAGWSLTNMTPRVAVALCFCGEPRHDHPTEQCSWTPALLKAAEKKASGERNTANGNYAWLVKLPTLKQFVEARREDEQCQICGAPMPCHCNEDVL